MANQNQIAVKISSKDGNTLSVVTESGKQGLYAAPANFSGYVKNTDYASESVAGVIKVSDMYRATRVSSGGSLQATTKTYQQYQNAENTMFIGKGTLENVITGKDLTTKSYVDSLVGDINTALDTINGEEV